MNGNLTMEQIESSIDWFTQAHQHLDFIRLSMNEQVFVPWVMSMDCRDSWNACNMARVHTENITDIEEALIPAMGCIFDGLCMFDHLQAAGLGMTESAQRCIVESLRSAQITLSGIIKDLEGRLCCNAYPEDLDEDTATWLREFEL